MKSELIYYERAALYDRVYAFKDYAGEAERLRGWLAAEGVADGSRVLEAACGTGNYLVPLARWYRIEGLDLSPAMLAVARRKLPETTLEVADLTTFSWPEPVDAVLCLFSSLGYVYPDERMRAAMRRFHAAVRPGGVAIVEPWIVQGMLDVGRPAMLTVDEPDFKLARLNTSRVEGRLCIFDMHNVVARRGEEVLHFVDHHELWSYSVDELLDAARAAGFEARWSEEGLMPGRGVVIARREGTAP